MPVWQLNDQLIFPNPQFAEPDGMLAIGTDFTIDRILLAYRSGIFPWFCHENEFYWFSPDYDGSFHGCLVVGGMI